MLGRGHEITEQAVADLSSEQLQHRGESWTIQPIAGVYAHVVAAEDQMVNGTLREQASVWETGGWGAKSGQDAADANTDIATLREYAQAVYAETDSWLASLSEADLNRMINVPWAGGGISVGQFLSSVITWHTIQHSGEICALKGVQGEKGLPF